jgi:hypothetical protein
MSLCKECDRPGWGTFHTCSLDGSPTYCVKCIWVASKDLPTEIIPVSAIKTPWYNLDWDGETAAAICQRKIGTHWERIKNADLSYPICVFDVSPSNSEDGEKSYEILDGCHRFVRACLQGMTEICVIKVPQHLLDQCIFR